MMEWFAAFGVPAATWVVSVERRLARLGTMPEKVDKIEDRVEKIYEHLIPPATRTGPPPRRGDQE